MLRLSLVAVCASVLLAQDGAHIYQTRCAACHDAPVGRIPPANALRAMSSSAILNSLDNGAMKTQAASLTEAERKAVADYLAAGASAKPASAGTGSCANQGVSSELQSSAAWSSWGANPANTRFQNGDAAGISPEQVPRLKLKWAFGLGEGTAERSQPAVAMGRVFVGSAAGKVYSLDAQTGCIHWVFRADSAVRSGIVVGNIGVEKKPAVFFGEGGNLYALDADTGHLLWKIRPDSHFAAIITAAPQFHNGVLYVAVSSFEEAVAASPKYECCTFRGSVAALDAATGAQIWKTYTIAAAAQVTQTEKSGSKVLGPSGAAVWSTPTFDEKRDAVYVSTGDNYSDPATTTSDAVLALDAKTGKLLWSQQATPGDIYNIGCETPAKANCAHSKGPDFDFGQPPMLVSLGNGRRALIIGQKSGLAHAFDPDSAGKPLWSKRIGQGGSLGGIQWGSAADDGRAYVALSDVRLHAVADSSVPQGYRLDLDPEHGGGLFALNVATGEIVWNAKPSACGDRKNCSPAQSAAVSAMPGAVFSGSLDGHLRAYASDTGAILWDADTEHEYHTVNGLTAHGGSLDVTGPVIAGGLLYVTSGYGQWGGVPGNVLLAYSVDGR